MIVNFVIKGKAWTQSQKLHVLHIKGIQNYQNALKCTLECALGSLSPPDEGTRLIGTWPIVRANYKKISDHGTVIMGSCVFNWSKGDRKRSPPLPKIAHPSLPRLGRSQVSTWPSAMHKSPPGGTTCLITVSTMPGKLTYPASLPALYPSASIRVVVICAKECYNVFTAGRCYLMESAITHTSYLLVLCGFVEDVRY